MRNEMDTIKPMVLVMAVLAFMYLANNANAQRYVYCKAIDDPNGPVYTFERACPVGYYPV